MLDTMNEQKLRNRLVCEDGVPSNERTETSDALQREAVSDRHPEMSLSQHKSFVRVLRLS